MVWLVQFGDSSFLATGPLQVRAVISYPGVIRGKVSKEPGKGGLLSP